MIKIGRIRIIRRAVYALFVLLNRIPCSMLIARSMATQTVNQASKFKHNFNIGLINAQSIRTIDELTMTCISVRTKSKNLIVNITTVKREIIEDPKRYTPHPTCLICLF